MSTVASPRAPFQACSRIASGSVPRLAPVAAHIHRGLGCIELCRVQDLRVVRTELHDRGAFGVHAGLEAKRANNLLGLAARHPFHEIHLLGNDVTMYGPSSSGLTVAAYLSLPGAATALRWAERTDLRPLDGAPQPKPRSGDLSDRRHETVPTSSRIDACRTLQQQMGVPGCRLGLGVPPTSPSVRAVFRGRIRGPRPARLVYDPGDLRSSAHRTGIK